MPGPSWLVTTSLRKERDNTAGNFSYEDTAGFRNPPWVLNTLQLQAESYTEYKKSKGIDKMDDEFTVALQYNF